MSAGGKIVPENCRSTCSAHCICWDQWHYHVYVNEWQQFPGRLEQNKKTYYNAFGPTCNSNHIRPGLVPVWGCTSECVALEESQTINKWPNLISAKMTNSDFLRCDWKWKKIKPALSVQIVSSGARVSWIILTVWSRLCITSRDEPALATEPVVGYLCEEWARIKGFFTSLSQYGSYVNLWKSRLVVWE